MRKRMKKIAALLLTGVMVAGLTACGGGDAKEEKAAKSSDGKTTIKITWWGGDTRHEYTQKLLDAYTAENPDVEFEATPAGWEGYFDKLSTQAASGSMPDIIQMDYLYIATYAKNNSLADLSEFVEDGTLDMSNVEESTLKTGEIDGIIQMDYLYIATYAKNNSLADLSEFVEDGTLDMSNVEESTLKTGEIDGKLAGIVAGTNALAVTYNPDVLKEVGIEAPTDDWTWDDYIKLNTEVSKAKGTESALTAEIDGKLAGIVAGTNALAVTYNPDVLKEVGIEAPTDDWTWDDYIKLNTEVSKAKGTESALTATIGPCGDMNFFNYFVRQHGETLFNEDGTGLGFDDDSITADYMWRHELLQLFCKTAWRNIVQ